MRVEVITNEAGLDALTPEWTALDTEAALRTPFTSPAWNLTWWRHFRRSSLSAHDELRVYAIRDDAGALVAVAPMMLTRRPGHGPIAMRELQFLGADQNMTEIRGLLCRAGQEPAVVHALHAHLQATREWDWVQWRGLRLPNAAAALPGFVPLRTLHDLVLPLPESWDALRASLPRNLKEALRKCRNSLARDGIEWNMDVLHRPDDVAAALPRLLALHRMRSKVETGVRHPDVFARDAARTFMVGHVADVARRGGIRLFALRIRDKHVAMRLGFLFPDELYLYYSGYDPAWSRYSVMTTVVAGAIEWATNCGLRRVNLSAGIDPSKTRWRPEEIAFTEGCQVAPGRRSAAAFRVAQAMRGCQSVAAPQPADAQDTASRRRDRVRVAESIRATLVHGFD